MRIRINEQGTYADIVSDDGIMVQADVKVEHRMPIADLAGRPCETHEQKSHSDRQLIATFPETYA